MVGRIGDVGRGAWWLFGCGLVAWEGSGVYGLEDGVERDLYFADEKLLWGVLPSE
jgi:hypothetical protein